MDIGKTRVYGCGGCGINIASHYYNLEPTRGMAELHVAFVDTSRSNLKPNMDQKDIFILDNADGAGKFRGEHDETIAKTVKKILLDLRPMDFNIVVFSAAGGSGSVIGPLIVQQLLERDLPVIALVVGSDESSITANNTMNTLKSLEVISKRADKPVVMAYAHNHRNIKRSEVNKEMHSVLGMLAVLSSRQNDALDTRDVNNWLNFNKMTSTKSQLALMEVIVDESDLSSCNNPISVLSLYRDQDSQPPNIMPGYHADGYMSTKVSDIDFAHFVIGTDGVRHIADNLKATIEQFREVHDSQVEGESLVDDDDNVSGSGLVV